MDGRNQERPEKEERTLKAGKAMDKQTITRDIKKEVGNWPCQSEIARYLGKSREYVIRILADTEFIRDGKKKQYLAADVAEVILKQRRL